MYHNRAINKVIINNNVPMIKVKMVSERKLADYVVRDLAVSLVQAPTSPTHPSSSTTTAAAPTAHPKNVRKLKLPFLKTCLFAFRLWCNKLQSSFFYAILMPPAVR